MSFNWRYFTPKSIICFQEGYSLSTFWKDLIAGLTVGIIALPLAMAFAIASGVSPEKGLFTAIIAGFLISALGGSRVQIGGPTGAFVVIIYGIVAKHGYEGLVTATLMAGVILMLMGLLRFGALLKFIPYPVTTGFTAGIALIIFSSQIKDFFGLELTQVPADFFEKWEAYFHLWNTAHGPTIAIAVGSLATILLFRRYAPRIPGPIVAVILASAATWLFHLPVDTIGTRFGGIPSSLPSPTLHFSFSHMRALVPEATTIALLAAIESLLSAVVADGMTGFRHKSNTELMAQGIANIGSVLFGGIPATGAIARTATNVKAGGKTPVAGMIHAGVLLLVMWILAPLASWIPLATLASILMVVAWNMSEMDHFRSLLKAPKSDVAVLLTTFTLTVVVDLTAAVQVGVIIAALMFMKRMTDVTQLSTTRQIIGEGDRDDDNHDANAISLKVIPSDTEVFEINGPFFFGVADLLKDTLVNLEKSPKVFILRLRKVPTIDATGLHALEEFYDKCRRRGTRLILSGVNPHAREAMARIGLDRHIGLGNIVPHIDAALAAAELHVRS